MAEVWLRTNRRALLLGLIVPGVLLAIGVGGLGWSLASGGAWWVQAIFVLVVAAPLWMIGELLYAAMKPRLAYEAGSLLVFLEPARPTRVPIGIVECFFLGQGPSDLPK